MGERIKQWRGRASYPLVARSKKPASPAAERKRGVVRFVVSLRKRGSIALNRLERIAKRLIGFDGLWGSSRRNLCIRRSL